jgi:hypothetical protein
LAEDAENCSNSAMGGTWVRGGGAGNRRSRPLLSRLLEAGVGEGGGRGRAGRRESKYVLALNATCMHVDVSLSHISVLLLQPLSI